MSLYQISVKKPGGGMKALSDYRGKAMLIVNVASKCGFTPQYTGLEALYRKFRGQGFEILGFPCNQFGHQEPGNADEIASFCALTYDVSFPIFGKIDVNGVGADPLYTYLKIAKRGLLGMKAIKWNFTKFLVDREGLVVARFAPTTKPEALEGAIAKLL